MQRSTHIFLTCLVVSLAFLDRGYAEKKPSIATAEFLTVLAKNVATVLSPTLVGELQEGRPNRTAVNASIAPSSSPSPKTLETTTEPSRLSNLEADTVRSAQTQSEVRPGGNQGFPFNFDENNYRYNYPGVNSPGYPGVNSPGYQRPDFPPGPFGNPGYYNPDLFRGYPGQGGPAGGLRPEDSGPSREEQVRGVSSVDTPGNGQTGRVPDSLEPSPQNFDRFRNFERFPFNNQFPGGPGNFQNFPFQSQRQDGRFSRPLVDQFNPNVGPNPNFPGNPNFPSSPNAAANPNLSSNLNAAANPNLLSNYQNSVGNNYPRNSFQSFADPFLQRQQGFRPNNFDFLPSQRFQNPYENSPRSLQRGPNFPGFYPGTFGPDLRDPENFATPTSADIDGTKTVEASSSDVIPQSEKLEIVNKRNSTGRVATELPEILSVQGKVRFGRLLLPALEDYSDLRFQPDSFRQYLFTANENDDKLKNKSNSSKEEINDV